MSEYIEREALLKATHNYYPSIDHYCTSVKCVTVSEIKDVPAADVVPVIRCADCKHYYAYPDDYRTCHEFYEVDGVSKMMAATDFCSHGERKEANT